MGRGIHRMVEVAVVVPLVAPDANGPQHHSFVGLRAVGHRPDGLPVGTAAGQAGGRSGGSPIR